MRATVWHGKRDVRVENVHDPAIKESNDIVIRVTSSGLCGSDLHLYEVLTPFMTPGDILGHEAIGIVEEVGSAISHLAPGDRVVVPFNIACGSCFMCENGLPTQCETTQVKEQGTGAALFGYTKLYGSVPGAQAEYLRVPEAQYGPLKVEHGPPDDRYVYLSDVLPTAWQAVEYAAVPDGGTLAVLGLGPIGLMCCRVARHRGIGRVLGVDLVSERLSRARDDGVETYDLRDFEDHDALIEALRNAAEGRGPDSVIDAVGTEAHGSPVARLAQESTGLLPRPWAERLMRRAGVDRLSALHLAVAVVRRGGTISVTGVYGGMTDPMPLMVMFDKQIQLRMGQANVRRWTDDIMPLLTDADPLGVDTFATHHLPLENAPEAYEMFQKHRGGAIKVLFRP